MVVGLAAVGAQVVGASAIGAPRAQAVPGVLDVPGRCSPSVGVVGYSDALDKRTYRGEPVAGLSALAHDARAGRYLALADRTPTTALIWPIGGLDELPVARPRVVGPPIRLSGRDGRPIPGRADNEGLAVLADGRFAVSSERGPAISVFDSDGRWRDDLSIPPRFRVAPLGQAVPNGTLEGLTATPAGDRLIAAMEKPLAGDDPGTIRMLDYRWDAGPGVDGRFVLARELLYRPAPGMRVAEIAAYGPDRLVVLEGAYSPVRGNSVVLTTADIGPRDGGRPDRVGIARGGTQVRHLARRPLADLRQCPTLGARTRQPQRNPLLDNYEGMAVSGARAGGHLIHLVVDDNHSPRQTTRLLTLWARLP